MLGAGDAIPAGLRAARREIDLLAPVALAELAAILFGLVPGLFFEAKSLAHARHVALADPQLALLAGMLETAFDSSTWPVFALAILLSAAGGFLIRTVAFAGALPVLSKQRPSFVESMLTCPSRWFATRALAGLFGLFAFVCVVGAILGAMTFFTAHPGVVAALGMTLATFAIVWLPFVEAGLQLAFVRSVVLEEPPLVAIASGLSLAWRRRGSVLAAWFVFVLADLAIGAALAFAQAFVDSAPHDDGFWVLLLVPTLIAFVFAAVARGAVDLARLGTFAAFAFDDALEQAPAPSPEAPAAG